MFKRKRIFSILLCVLILLASVSASITASASTERTIYGGNFYTNASRPYYTPSFKLNSNEISYSFWRQTKGGYNTYITLQKYGKYGWNNVASATAYGSNTARGVFSNLDPESTYRVYSRTSDPDTKMTSMFLDEKY